MRRSTELLLALAILVGMPAAEEDPPLGSQDRPVHCDGVGGERWYLGRLRTADGARLRWRRLGSFGGNPQDGHIIDGYQVVRADARPAEGEEPEVLATIFLDMYHPRYVSIQAVPGFRLVTEYSADYEYRDGLVHAFGEEEPFSGAIDETDDQGERTTATVEAGVLTGELVVRWPAGGVKRRTPYGLLNRPHGEEVWTRADGTPWARYTYADGILDGPYVFHDEDGSVESRGRYERGRRIEDPETSE